MITANVKTECWSNLAYAALGFYLNPRNDNPDWDMIVWWERVKNALEVYGVYQPGEG